MRNARIGKALFIGCLLGLLLVIFVITVPAANAQVCPAWVDQVSCLQQDAYNIVHNARLQNRANQAITDLENLIFRNGYYGYYDGGVFNPVYDRNRQPIGRRERNVSLGAAAGLGVYGATGSGRAGLVTGAGLFGVLTAVDAIRGQGHGDDRQPDCRKPVRKQKDWEREACSTIAAEQQAFVQQQAAQAELAERQQMATFYNNKTGRPVYVLDGNERIAMMQPNETLEFREPQSGYRAMRHFKAKNGRTVFRPAENRLERDGSISFVTPEGEVD